MNKLRNIFRVFGFFLISTIIIGLTFFFLEQSIITVKTPGYYFDPLSLPHQIIVAVIILVLISFFAIYIIPKVRISFNGIAFTMLLLTFLVLEIINIISIPASRELLIAFHDGTFNQIILNVTATEKVTAIVTLVVNLVFIFFIILLLPNHPDFFKLLHFLIYFVVLIGIGAIVYSVIKEWDTYYTIFNNGYQSGIGVPASFFNNRNPYASFLLSSQLLVAFLYFNAKSSFRRFLLFAFQIPFVIAITFTFSKTNVLLTYLVILVTYYHHVFRLLKKGKIARYVIEFTISLLLLFGFITVLNVSIFENLPIYSFLRRFFPDGFEELSARSIESRIRLWRYLLSLIVASPVTFLFGDGPHLSRIFYQSRLEQEFPNLDMNGFGDYHNGLIEVLHTFGVVGLAIYLIVIVLSLIFIIRRFKTNTQLGIYLIFSLLVFMGRSQTESLAMILFKSEGIMASFTFVLPFLYFMRKSHDEGYGPELIIKSRPPKPAH